MLMSLLSTGAMPARYRTSYLLRLFAYNSQVGYVVMSFVSGRWNMGTPGGSLDLGVFLIKIPDQFFRRRFIGLSAHDLISPPPQGG